MIDNAFANEGGGAVFFSWFIDCNYQAVINVYNIEQDALRKLSTPNEQETEIVLTAFSLAFVKRKPVAEIILHLFLVYKITVPAVFVSERELGTRIPREGNFSYLIEPFVVKIISQQKRFAKEGARIPVDQRRICSP